MGIVYCATNNTNGKSYIGKTLGTIEERGRNQWTGCLKFNAAIRKYGKSGFVWRILFESNDEAELLEREQFWIKAYNTVDEGYNLTYGGEGMRPSEETRQKLRDSHKGKVLDPESIRKREETRRSNGWNKNPEETARKKSEKQKGVARPWQLRGDNQFASPVVCIETKEKFPSIKDAERQYPKAVHISMCCRGERKSTGGLHWKYVD
jgi:group I intron endonuclease